MRQTHKDSLVRPLLSRSLTTAPATCLPGTLEAVLHMQLVPVVWVLVDGARRVRHEEVAAGRARRKRHAAGGSPLNKNAFWPDCSETAVWPKYSQSVGAMVPLINPSR